LPALGIIWVSPEAYSQSYFQQEVNYNIHVTLNDTSHALSCFETIDYKNNSPDTLEFLYFHLWPNAYSDNNTQLARELIKRDGKSKLFKREELRGYIDSLDFEVDGQGIIWSFEEGYPDICQLKLNVPLKPGETIKISTPFHLKIPEGVTSRLGHIGQSYQISQWYPKPAVYDHTGWHQMPYLDQGEFYSEYGRFDVDITLPENYVVGASGNLQTTEEKARLDRLSSDTAWMKIPDYINNEFPLSSGQMKTIRYTENNIHKFA